MANEINIKSEPNSNIEVTDISTIATDITEGATLKEINSNTSYDNNKKYIYKTTTNNVTIQDGNHFKCIKNGYTSLPAGIDHYYIKDNTKYTYHAVPSTDTWAKKLSFSEEIKNKQLYSIENENKDRIYIDGFYYNKNGNDFIKQTQKSYTLFNDIESIYWGESNKYTCSVTMDENLNFIEKWQNKKGSLATSGYYISINEQNDNGSVHYIVSPLYLNFDNTGICTDTLGNVTLYKLDNNPDGQYIKNGNKLYQLTVGMDSLTLYTNPVNTIDYIYENLGTYLYPNHEAYESFTLYTDSNNEWHEDNIFILYTPTTASTIAKVSHDSYTIYEKTAVKINYNYSGDANSLIPVYVSESAPLNNLSS